MSAIRYAKNPQYMAGYYFKNEERIKRYREENKEMMKANQKRANEKAKREGYKWQKANPDKMKAGKKRYRSKPEKKALEKATRKKWYQANTEIEKRKVAEYSKKNAEKVAKKNKEWRRRNMPKVLAWNRNRKARLKNLEGRHTKADIGKLFNNQKGKCIVCFKSLLDGYHVDHIQPMARGGSNWPSNLQLLCPPCNLDKRARDPIEFMQSRGFLI